MKTSILLYDPYMSCYGLAVHAISIYYELVQHKPCSEIKLCERRREENSIAVEIGLADPWGCDKSILSEIEDYLHRLSLCNIKINCASNSLHCSTSSEHLKKIINRFKTIYMRKLISYTENSNKEFFMAVSWRGEVFIGEGEESSITLPLIRGVLFAHTHPSPNCLPSHRDILSFQDFFGEGGLVEFIVSNKCYLVAYTETLTEEDYWKLQDIAMCIKRAKNYENYSKCLRSIYSLKSIWVEINPL